MLLALRKDLETESQARTLASQHINNLQAELAKKSTELHHLKQQMDHWRQSSMAQDPVHLKPGQGPEPSNKSLARTSQDSSTDSSMLWQWQSLQWDPAELAPPELAPSSKLEHAGSRRQSPSDPDSVETALQGLTEDVLQQLQKEEERKQQHQQEQPQQKQEQLELPVKLRPIRTWASSASASALDAASAAQESASHVTAPAGGTAAAPRMSLSSASTVSAALSASAPLTAEETWSPIAYGPGLPAAPTAAADLPAAGGAAAAVGTVEQSEALRYTLSRLHQLLLLDNGSGSSLNGRHPYCACHSLDVSLAPFTTLC